MKPERKEKLPALFYEQDREPGTAAVGCDGEGYHMHTSLRIVQTEWLGTCSSTGRSARLKPYVRAQLRKKV